MTRIKTLPFHHHRLVAPMHDDPKEQKMWIKRAKNNKWSVSQLREAIKEEYKEPPIPLAEGTYNVIYADPPWKYDRDQHMPEAQLDTDLFAQIA